MSGQSKNVVRSARAGWVVRFVAVVLLLTGASEAAASPITANRRTDRGLDVWFGTLTVVGAPAFSQDVVELTDLINSDIISAIDADLTVDAAARNALFPGGVWDTVGQTGIEWVIAPPDNLTAQQNLIAAYTAVAAALFGPGSLTLSGSTMIQRDYLLGSFDTVETGPVIVGDTDSPSVSPGPDGQMVIVTNDFVAEARFFQQNATWTPAPPAPIPEPATVSLMLAGLAGLRYARRRRSN